MKKFLAGFSVVCLLLTLFTGVFKPLASARAEISGDYAYIVDGDNATITGYTGKNSGVVIPNTLDGYPVTSICNFAFQNCTFLTSVTIPTSVTSIGEFAFLGCTRLPARSKIAKSQPAIKGEQKNYSFPLVLLFSIFLVILLLALSFGKNKRKRSKRE